MTNQYEVKTGNIKWYSDKKGFGFIVPHETGADVFVHATAVEAAGLNTLKPGEKIEYILKPSRGKLSAANLRIVK